MQQQGKTQSDSGKVLKFDKIRQPVEQRRFQCQSPTGFVITRIEVSAVNTLTPLLLIVFDEVLRAERYADLYAPVDFDS